MELTYTKHSDYYLPDLDIPAKEKVSVNQYGRKSPFSDFLPTRTL